MSAEIVQFIPKANLTRMSAEIIQFIPRANPDRDALIRDARAIYDGIFPVDYTQVVDTAPCEYVAPESDPA